MNNAKVKEKLVAYVDTIQTNIYMKSITSAMIGLMAILMVSSIASIISQLNIGASQEFIIRIGLKDLLNHINAMTINVISVYLAFLVAYNLGSNLKSDALNSGIIGIMSFLILTPLSAGEGFKGFNLSSLDSSSMFVAMFAGLVGARLYVLFLEKKLIIKMPDSIPPVVGKSFAAIIPGTLVAFIMGTLYMLISLTSYGDLASIIYATVLRPLTSLGANIGAVMLIAIFIEFLWFFGVHGSIAVLPILMLVFYQPQLANLAAYAAGEPLPYLFTLGFITINRGARSFAVALLCIFRSKSAQLKAVGKVGLVPAIFGISEPIKFGIPQVMNLRMLIPLMLTPAVSIFSAWALTISGFLPFHNGVRLPLGTPIILNGLIAHGWQGVVAQILQLALCIVIYIPFIRSQDKAYLAEEKARVNGNSPEDKSVAV